MLFFSLSLQQPLSSANFLYELDKITQDVLMVSVFLLPGASMSSSHQSNSKLKLTNGRTKSPFATTNDVKFNNMNAKET